MSFGSIEGAAIRLDRSSLRELARILARKDVAAMPTTRLLRAAAAMPIDAAAPSKPSTRHRSRRASGSLLAHPSATIFLSALVQASVSALRRYASRERRTPMRWRGACTSWRGSGRSKSPATSQWRSRRSHPTCWAGGLDTYPTCQVEARRLRARGAVCCAR